MGEKNDGKSKYVFGRREQQMKGVSINAKRKSTSANYARLQI